MNKQAEKLRLIYIPFLIIALSIILGYTYLNWLIMIKLQLFPIKEKFVIYMPPFVISGIAVLIWLRPRIKLLALPIIRTRETDFIYYYIAIIAISVPTIFAQEYMTAATGKLTELENISQIDSHAPTKYYKLENSYIDKKDIYSCYNSTVIGKSENELLLEVYVVCPVLPDKPSNYENIDEKVNYSMPLLIIDGKKYPGIKLSAIPKDKIVSINILSLFASFQNYGEIAQNGAILITTNHFIPEIKVTETILKSIVPDTVKCWLGIKYTTKISNNSSNDQKDTLNNKFIQNSKKDFQMNNFSEIVYLKRLGITDEFEDYKYAINKSPWVQSSKIILLPVFEPFEARSGNNLSWIFLSFGIGSLVWLIMILHPELKNIDLSDSELKESWK